MEGGSVVCSEDWEDMGLCDQSSESKDGEVGVWQSWRVDVVSRAMLWIWEMIPKATDNQQSVFQGMRVEAYVKWLKWIEQD